MARPAIPMDLQRRVKVEAGHRCAIPTCRHIEVELHHIIPWESCNTHDYPNLIALCPNCHSRADRGEIDRKALRLYKANLCLAHDKFAPFEVDLLLVLAQRRNSPPEAILTPMLPLYRRVIDAGFIVAQQNSGGSSFTFGVEISPRLLYLTQAGAEFVEALGLHEA